MTAANHPRPRFIIEKPFPKRTPQRRKGDAQPFGCFVALPLIGALILKHGAKALLKKVRSR